MDKLIQLGFEPDDFMAHELAQANPRLEPLLFKYEQMGTYYVITKSDLGYGLYLVGGPNPLIRRQRLDRYRDQLGDNLSLTDIIQLANQI